MANRKGRPIVPDDATPIITVDLPQALLRLFPDAASPVEVSAATVQEMVDALNARWPGMRDRLADSSPRIRRNINVFVEGQRATLSTPLKPGAPVTIRIAMLG
jgi:molybdopterin converting factor small subunit